MILLDEIEKPPITDIRPPSYHANPNVWETSPRIPPPTSPLPPPPPSGRSYSPLSSASQSQFHLAPPVHPLRTLIHARSASSLATQGYGASTSAFSNAVNNSRQNNNSSSSDIYPYETPALSSSTLAFPTFSYRSVSPSLTNSVGHSSPSATPPNIQPSNSLYIARENTSIRGQYIIDTSLHIPECLLPKLKKTERRRSLKLETSVGDVSADVWVCGGWAQRRVLSDALESYMASSSSTIVGGHGHGHGRVPSSSSSTYMDENGMLNSKNNNNSEARNSFDTDSSASHFDGGTAESVPAASCSGEISTTGCADLEMRTTQGSIYLTVQTPSPHRLRIYAHTSRGSIHIRIPRSFRGVLRSFVDTCEVEFSIGILETLKELAINADDGLKFVRKCRAWSVGEDAWWQRPRLERDEVNVECGGNGSIQIAFIDETESDIPKNHDILKLGKILTKARRSRGTY